MSVKKSNNLIILSSIAAIFAIGIIVININQSTSLKNQAAGGANLNTSSEISYSNNPDGTMGPANWTEDFSQTLPLSQRGQLSFAVTDPSPASTASGRNNGPVQVVNSLNMTISKVEVHLAYLGNPPFSSPQPSAKIDRWETLNINAPITVDLVKLAKTGDISTLGITSLAAGHYTEVRLYITSASATLTDGSSVTLTIPGKDNIVRIVREFNVTSGSTTNLIIDFDAQNSIIKAGGMYLLRPVVGKFSAS